MKKVLEIVRFALSGLVGVGAYFAVLYSCTEFLGFWYPVSSLVAGTANIGVSFVLHKLFTFRAIGHGRTASQLFRYTMLLVSLSLANAVLLLGLVELTKISYLFVQVPLTVLLSAISYLVTKMIFKGEPHTE